MALDKDKLLCNKPHNSNNISSSSSSTNNKNHKIWNLETLPLREMAVALKTMIIKLEKIEIVLIEGIMMIMGLM